MLDLYLSYLWRACILCSIFVLCYLWLRICPAQQFPPLGFHICQTYYVRSLFIVSMESLHCLFYLCFILSLVDEKSSSAVSPLKFVFVNLVKVDIYFILSMVSFHSLVYLCFTLSLVEDMSSSAVSLMGFHICQTY